ncbi:exocyst complex component sec8 [Desarmillaria tabescens]|uniref:Exocyst complex component Sec8 n=1 Tax=Armillaria tabescens TaxID=1929756 RepID=A0AA39NG38_ARMTA|nr:exocyst complex component sec8 [Desarmillaria tabescens]KAK0465001.1 exocyst complex component sec8 [Desarmillaria tabescens]
MSRPPPFSSRRGRSPSFSNGIPTISPPLSAPGMTMATRPLQISRSSSRPTTPSNSSIISTSPRATPPNTAPVGPSRPQRSELRARASDFTGNDRGSTSYRDSISTTRSDASSSLHSRTITSTPVKTRPPKPQRLNSSPTDDEQTPTPTSLSSVMSAFQSAGRRRAMTNGSDDLEYQKEKRVEMEAEKARQQRIRDKVPGWKVNGKARAGDIDAVLDQIRDEWAFVIDPDFNPVDLALQLLDDSSLGKDIDSFHSTKNLLSKALQGSVDRHHQAFAAALPHHANLLNHLGAMQTQINETRTALQESKDALGSKRADLVQLWARGQTLEEMMRLLDQIEHLKSVPDLLETLMSEKRLLQASVLLVRSLKIINKPEMLEIGAVSDLRSYLLGQETALREILTDELHSHLYLKSFWCDSRWAAYTPNQRTFPKLDFENGSLPTPSQTSPSSATFRRTRLARFIDELTLRPNDPPHDLDDPNFRNGFPTPSTSSISNITPVMQNSNPETDSFAYMETVLESLAVLSRLGSALDNVAQRVPNEIFALVETTLDEVSDRAEYGRRGSVYALMRGATRSEGVYVFATSVSSLSNRAAGNRDHLNPSCLRLSALESSAKQVDHEILKDFFWTLYSKMDAVAQGLRVIYEVANRIGSRRDFKDSAGTKPGALFPLADIWMSVQSEIRTLISDYLTNEEQGAASGRNPVSSINEILREGRYSRDKTKGAFRFADSDVKLTNKLLRPHEDELTRVIKDTMPGLVQGASDNTVQAALSTVGVDDRILGAGQHHRLLIEPDTFHVTVLFEPTLAFLARVAETLPSGTESTRDSSAVLDDFVLKVYLPQLEEKVSSLFHEAVTGHDAFLPDPLSAKFCPEPLVKASTHLMALINSLCAMLQTTPFHRENYSRLILGVIIQFYQRCSDRFQDLVSTPAEDPQAASHVALAVQWAQRSESSPCLRELLSTPPSNISTQQQLCRQETNLELDFLRQDTVKETDLVPSIRNLSALASLYRSVAWFASELSALKSRPPDAPMSPLSLEPLSATSASSPVLPLPQASSETAEPLALPLSKEMSLRFGALLKTYEQLSELILDTIRIDIRCRTIYYLDSALRYGNYSMEQEAGEPDPHVIDLNNELGECDEFLSTSLSETARRFIFVGLGYLMEHILIANARYLGVPTSFGIKKIIRNMLALQQSVKAITNDQNSEFEKAKRYYTLFFMSPQAMLDGIRQKQLFTFDEYLTMLRLQCGVDQTEGDPRASKAINRNYSMYVIDLHGLEMENSAS